VDGTAVARDLRLSRPGGRPLAGELDFRLRSLTAGPVTVGETLLAARIVAVDGPEPERLVLTAVDIPLTIAGATEGRVARLSVAMPNLVDFAGAELAAQFRAQAFAVTAQRLASEVRGLPVTVDSVQVNGRVDDLTVTAAGISSSSIPGVRASGRLHADATQPLRDTVGEFRVTVDPEAIPMPEGWSLNGQPHDLAVQVRAKLPPADAPAASADAVYSVAVILPASDADSGELEEARGLDGLTLKAPWGQLRGSPKVRVDLRQSAAGHIGAAIHGGLHEMTVSVAGVAIAGGELGVSASVADSGSPAPSPPCPSPPT
jgi:hypothetical protein